MGRDTVQIRVERAAKRAVYTRTADTRRRKPAASRVLSSFATSKAAADVPPRVRGDIVHIRAERAAKRAISTVAADKSRTENRPQAEYLFPFTIREAAADAKPSVRRDIVDIRAERAAKRSLPRTTADKSKDGQRPHAEYLFPFQ